MPQIFISHTEIDAGLALEIALGLEESGYRTWSYKLDAIGALSYLQQTKQAVDGCTALVLIISPSALQSNQVGIEVVRAHERNKRFVPLLHGLTHEEFRKQEPEWGGVLGAATSIELRHGNLGDAVPKILAGLRAIGIECGEPTAARIATIRALRDAPRAPQPVYESPAITGAPDARALSSRTRVRLPLLALLALLVAAALVWRLRIWPPLEGADGVATVTESSAPILPELKRPAAPEEAAGSIVLGVMDFEAQDLGHDDDWMRQSTRDSFNTILSNVQEVRVYAKEKIDFLCNKRGLDLMECADKLAMTKVVRGKLRRSKANVALEVRVIDIRTGFLEMSFEASRPAGDIIALQNDLAMQLLQKLGIKVSEQRRETLLASRTNDAADSIKLLSETFADFPGGKQEPGASLPVRRYLTSLLRWLDVAPAPALAAETDNSLDRANGTDEEAILDVLQGYGAALQAKDMERLELVLADLSTQQRSAHERYFENAEDLVVEISHPDVLVEGDEAMVSFTRKDSFKESKSGRDRTLEVRLTTLLKKQDGKWKIASFAK